MRGTREVRPERATPIAVLCVCAVLAGWPASGRAEEELPPTRGGTRDASSVTTERIIIYGRRESLRRDEVPDDVLEAPAFMNVGEGIADLPGVGAVRRAASSTEPVIRGLGWERVTTQIGHMPIHGACPSRMDPPITYVKPHAVRKVRVIKGLPSVTLGPGGTGGRIVVDNDYVRDAGSEAELHGDLRVGGQTARDGWGAGAGLYGGNAWLDALGSFEAARFGDYESGNGTRVTADQEELGAALSLGLRPAGGHRWSNTLNYVHEENVDFPSLPMDIVKTDGWTATTGYRMEDLSGWLEAVELDGGWSDIHHVMSNAKKANRSMLEAATPSDSVGSSLRLATELAVFDGMRWTVGADFQDLRRDATRTRRFLVGPMAGRVFEDRIWPDARQWDLGAFVETAVDVAADWRLRVGGRLDRVESAARAADAPSLGGMSVSEAWVSFYGDEAERFDRGETLGAGNGVLEWSVTPDAVTRVGVGYGTRAAGVTERYFAFAPAPGGFLVGNPALDPERKVELEWGLDWSLPVGELSLAVYHSWVDDYILQTALVRRDVDGDGDPELVRGFENVDARLYGFEAALRLEPLEHVSVPLSLAYTRGRNVSEDRDLPEIPPLEGRAAVVVSWAGTWPGHVELGGRFAAAQTKVDPDFPEDTTPSFGVMHLRGGVDLIEDLRLDLAIENLLDTEYHEHLTREALLPSDDLAPGDEVPAPGRGFHATLTARF